jgi:arylsulfatase A-like enzyme
MLRFLLLFAALLSSASVVVGQGRPPNIVFILADDLGYGELGSYGQTMIRTPALDRMAAEGVRFTQFYAGSTVCAPSRSVLMTGQHTGHTRVRGNAGGGKPGAQMLRSTDVTVARVLQQAGYATALIGKWGLGMNQDEGEPRRHGFDYYYGYLSQGHAHNHFPDFLWRNGEKIALPNLVTRVGADGAGYATKRVTYAGDLFADEARTFVRGNRDRPFFLYLSLVVPHANNERSRALGDGNEVPDLAPYTGEKWNDSQKGHAAMITRMDRQIGELLEEIKRLGLDERTLVLFSSDNGPHREGGPNYDPEFFRAGGPLSGIKRSLKEGGIRVPLLARWPGRIKPGRTSNHVGYFGDLMATFAEIAGVKPPGQLDSHSLAPEFFGQGSAQPHEYLYWEFYEGGVSQAVLLGSRWKAIRPKGAQPIELFDLSQDIGEHHDVAAQNPDIVRRIAGIMRSAHVDNEHWRFEPVAGDR